MIYYSPTTGGFYDTDFATYKVPADAVEIGVGEHYALLDAQVQGQVIQLGTDGRPYATLPMVDGGVILATQAQAILDSHDAIWARMSRAGQPWPSDWAAYDEALRDVVRGKASALPVAPTTPPWGS